MTGDLPASPLPELSPVVKAALDEAYADLTPIAARATNFGERELAKIAMRLIEAMRGDEKKTPRSLRHHA